MNASRKHLQSAILDLLVKYLDQENIYCKTILFAIWGDKCMIWFELSITQSTIIIRCSPFPGENSGPEIKQ